MHNLHNYINRRLESDITIRMNIFPAVLIAGSRQCGKSTLVKMLAQGRNDFIYLDLQNMADVNKLTEPSLFFAANDRAVICLDEIQSTPHLFSALRCEIDRNRRSGRFILLGSASPELIQKSSESLAGRIGVIELAPFSVDELMRYNPQTDLHDYWNRGGYPESFLSANDESSSLWREAFIQTYVQRDVPQLGFQIPALQIRRFMTLCAHLSGQLLNMSKVGESLGMAHTTVKRYIDLLEQTFLIRTLAPYETNEKKRLVKSPKLYVRDVGILHQLLQIRDYNSLLGNPIFGASWESLVVENICSVFSDCRFSFYRNSAGDEIDLVIQKATTTIAVECKASVAPQLSKGFWRSMAFVKPQRAFVVIPVKADYPIAENVEVCGLYETLTKLSSLL